MYMIEFTYSNENERKRIEYLFTRLSSGGRKVRAYTYLLDDEAFEAIKKELQGKFPEENISVYKVEPLEFQRKDVKMDSMVETGRTEGEVTSFMNYLISKKRGVFEGNDPLGSSTYKVYTRKGLIWVKFSTSGKERCRLRISFDGPEDAVQSVRDEFMKEIEVFLESK